MNTVSFVVAGRTILIDEEDLLIVAALKWHICQNPKGRTVYAASAPRKREYVLMHRLIMGAPKDKEVDHRNYNGLDNRKSNLRLCSRFQNQWHSRLRSDNKSGYRGVTWNEECNKWSAQFHYRGIKTYLGLFLSAEEASQVYEKAVKELRGEFA